MEKELKHEVDDIGNIISVGLENYKTNDYAEVTESNRHKFEEHYDFNSVSTPPVYIFRLSK